MKIIQVVLLLMFSLFAWCLSAQVDMTPTIDKEVETSKTGVKQGASIEFHNPQINLGEIKRGDKRSMEFNFTNTGTEALQIEIVSGCECTTLDWPRLPIKPGDSGIITAIFDSTEKEKSEIVDIDIYFENIDPETKHPMFKMVQYAFQFEE